VAEAFSDIEVFMSLYNKRRKYELLGEWLRLKGEHGLDAGVMYVAAVQRFRDSRPLADRLAKVTSHVARFLRELQYFAQAELLYKAALVLNETVFGEWSSQTAKTFYLLSECLWNQGLLKEALPHCERSLEIRERVLGEHDLSTAMSLCGLGELILEEDPARAKTILKRALSIRVAHFGENHPLVARCLQDLAVIADNEGCTEDAIELCERAIRVRETALGPHHPHLAASLETLGTIWHLKGEYLKAEGLFRRALSIFQGVHGDAHTSCLSCLEWLAHVYTSLNRPNDVARHQALALKVKQDLASRGIKLSERIAD